MKFGVVVFPGSNCDRDMLHVLSDVFHQEVREIWHKESKLDGFGNLDCIVLPGGFSYGDYLRTGAIARFSPIMNEVISFANKGGLVVGICNGFQILCEAGLLPGALMLNQNQQFVCKNTWIKVENNQSRWTTNCEKGQVLNIPVAHADGRYQIDSNGLKSLQENEQILFKYCNSQGEVDDASNFNGSIQSIAGVCNKQGNVFGMMPHPERASEGALGNEDGACLFESLLSSVNV